MFKFILLGVFITLGALELVFIFGVGDPDFLDLFKTNVLNDEECEFIPDVFGAED